MIEVKSKMMEYGINFPSSVKELTPDILNTLTEGVKLPKHYCIIALAFDTKIFDFCVAMNSKRETNVAVTPILAKIAKEDSDEINANVGDKVIIERSSLERGAHINIKTVISSNAARNYFSNASDILKSITGKLSKDDKDSVNVTERIIVLEFKICPVCDIAAALPMNYRNIDPFIVNGGASC